MSMSEQCWRLCELLVSIRHTICYNLLVLYGRAVIVAQNCLGRIEGLAAAMFEPVRGGTRGGQAEFKWSDVSADKDREASNT